MWIAGIQQGAMLKIQNADGTLMYTFMDTLAKIYPYWILRTVAGLIFTVGMVIFILNIVLTIVKGRSLSQSRA
jgi:cytochrome c oxidase cbb3-type subunit 1